jgi:hypothetical protein
MKGAFGSSMLKLAKTWLNDVIYLYIIILPSVGNQTLTPRKSWVLKFVQICNKNHRGVRWGEVYFARQ